MDDLIGDSVAPRRLNFVLVAAFAVVALVLTAAGLYGVMAYLVAQRTREIGVRMALGATRLQVLALVLRQAGTMTLLGIGLGVAGALAADAIDDVAAVRRQRRRSADLRRRVAAPGRGRAASRSRCPRRARRASIRWRRFAEVRLNSANLEVCNSEFDTC